MSQDLTSGIRRAAAPPRQPGHKPPSTAGVNQGDPTLSPQPPATQPAGGQAPAFPARNGGHEDRGWHELNAVEHRAYVETLVSLGLADGESLTLDPTRAQIWRVAVSGAGIITVAIPEFPTASNTRQDAPERKRSWSCVLIVDVAEGATFPSINGVKWSEGRTAPDVTRPDGTVPTEEEGGWKGRYVFTFVHDPVAEEVLGFEGGSRF